MNENFDVTYKALFRRYYPSLIFYATRLVGEEEAEDVVQDVFVELWKRKDHIEIGDQIQAFLYRAVYTRALNVLKHRSVEDGYCVAMEEINQRRAEFYQPDNNEVIRTGNSARKSMTRLMNSQTNAKRFSNLAICMI